MQISGTRLRRARERRALALRELAEVAGVNYVTIWRLEAEESASVRPATVRKLAAALAIDPEELVVWDDDGATDETGKAAA